MGEQTITEFTFLNKLIL